MMCTRRGIIAIGVIISLLVVAALLAGRSDDNRAVGQGDLALARDDLKNEINVATQTYGASLEAASDAFLVAFGASVKSLDTATINAFANSLVNSLDIDIETLEPQLSAVRDSAISELDGLLEEFSIIIDDFNASEKASFSNIETLMLTAVDVEPDELRLLISSINALLATASSRQNETADAVRDVLVAALNDQVEGIVDSYNTFLENEDVNSLSSAMNAYRESLLQSYDDYVAATTVARIDAITAVRDALERYVQSVSD